MATTTTKTYTDNTSSSAKSTWVFKTTWQNALSVGSSSTFTIPATSVEITRTQTAYGAGAATNYIYYGSYTHYCEVLLTSWASGSTKTASSSSTTRNVSSFFNSNNPADRTYSISVTASYQAASWASASSITSSNSVEAWNVSLGTLVLTLNAPPTVEHYEPTYATPHYTGRGAYTISGIDAEAYYGGTIASIKLAIGADSVVQNYSTSSVTEQTLSLTPSQAGTFTPTLTVTDSRGQVTTESLPQITVNPYLEPTLSYDVYRTDEDGIKDDEGHCALIKATMTYTSAIANLTAPTMLIDNVSIDTLLDLYTSGSANWYSSYSSSTGVDTSSVISDWSTVGSGDEVYCLVDLDYDSSHKFAEDTSYEFTLTANDDQSGHSQALTQTLSTAFYTIDFKAGGKEIAFGAPAKESLTNYPNGLFKCSMDTSFNDMTQQEVDDFVDDLNYTGSAAADYIVEQGTSGIWTFRKWQSGIAECWGKWTGTLSHYSQATFYAYNTGLIAYPNGLFIEEPNTQFSGRIGSGFCLTGTLYNCTKDNFYGYAMSTASGSQSCVFFIYARGRWKA